MAKLDPGFEATEPGYGHMPQPEESADASPEAETEEPKQAEAEQEEAVEAQESEADSPPADEENVEEKTEGETDEEFQKRLNKLAARFRTLERDSQQALDDARRENEELRKQLQTRPQEPMKTLADFNHDEVAWQQYMFEEAERRASAAVEQRLAQSQEPTKPPEYVAKFANAETKFAAEHDDYHDVVYDPTLRISPDMRDYIQTSDIGPELVYHLGKNPDVAMNIAELPPALAGRELAKIESGLARAAAKPKQVSNAPPPPPKGLGGGTAAPSVKTTDPKSDKLSDDEWFAKEEARLAKQRG